MSPASQLPNASSGEASNGEASNGEAWSAQNERTEARLARLRTKAENLLTDPLADVRRVQAALARAQGRVENYIQKIERLSIQKIELAELLETHTQEAIDREWFGPY
jgi:molecular chaperone GrpE (heat shock protein)